MSALGPFHSALFARLNAHPGLAGYQHASMAAETPPRVGVETYDRVAADAPYPYNVLESATEVHVPYMGGRGFDDTAQVGTWDQYDGWQRALDVAALMDAALVEPLTVAGFGLVYAEVENRQTVRDPSGLRRVVSRIRGRAAA